MICKSVAGLWLLRMAAVGSSLLRVVVCRGDLRGRRVAAVAPGPRIHFLQQISVAGRRQFATRVTHRGAAGSGPGRGRKDVLVVLSRRHGRVAQSWRVNGRTATAADTEPMGRLGGDGTGAAGGQASCTLAAARR